MIKAKSTNIYLHQYIIFTRLTCTQLNQGSDDKTCHRDRIARLTAPCPSHKKLNVKLFANADSDANADAGGSTIALPGLRPGELKMRNWSVFEIFFILSMKLYIVTSHLNR